MSEVSSGEQMSHVFQNKLTDHLNQLIEEGFSQAEICRTVNDMAGLTVITKGELSDWISKKNERNGRHLSSLTIRNITFTIALLSKNIEAGIAVNQRAVFMTEFLKMVTPDTTPMEIATKYKINQQYVYDLGSLIRKIIFSHQDMAEVYLDIVKKFGQRIVDNFEEKQLKRKEPTDVVAAKKMIAGARDYGIAEIPAAWRFRILMNALQEPAIYNYLTDTKYFSPLELEFINNILQGHSNSIQNHSSWTHAEKMSQNELKLLTRLLVHGTVSTPNYN